MTKPLLSIVIANYNYGRFLEEAIQSVISQGVGDKIELIICDAASTDNSVDIIKKYANGLPPNVPFADWNNSQLSTPNSQLITWWCSEKDGGQSAAFNKGFSHARGEWLTWLNSDDLLLPGTLKAFFKRVERCKNAEWITGNKIHFDSKTGEIIRINWGPHIIPPFIRGKRAFSAVFGPTTFWRKSLYEQLGEIDEKLHYAMDSEYWARMTMAGIKQIRLHHVCWAFRDHKDSKTSGVQTNEIKNRRTAETAYWRKKLNYYYKPAITNPWYVLWCMWRIVDGSLAKRKFLKCKYEGSKLSLGMEYK